MTTGGLKVDVTADDDEDNYDTEITWSIVGGFLFFVALGVGIHYCCSKCKCCMVLCACCMCCRKKQIVEKEKEERLRVFKNEALGIDGKGEVQMQAGGDMEKA